MSSTSITDLLGDNSLVSRAKGGDSVALSLLIERYSNTILQKAKSFNNLNGLESEDLYQEGMMGFVSAVYSFDDCRGVKFSTYSLSASVNRMLTAIRDSNNGSGTAMISYVPLDENMEILSETPSPEEAVIHREELDEVMTFLDNNLSKMERRVLKLLLLGVSYAEIADIIDCSAKSVDNTIQRIRRKIRAFKSE